MAIGEYYIVDIGGYYGYYGYYGYFIMVINNYFIINYFWIFYIIISQAINSYFYFRSLYYIFRLF